jgi:putative MATE family efflux protein
MYNMVDTWVVGNYVSNEAFSAVGTVGPIINTLIGFFAGLASGAGVVISQYYGAKREEDVSKAVHTAIAMTLAAAVLVTALGLFLMPHLLQLMKTPEDVLPQSTLYLTIYFSGIVGLMLYNMGAGILRSVGDSSRPFYFLVICALLNTALDLLFVLGFHMGVDGVALATVISQCVSAILVLITLYRSDGWIRFRFRKLRIHGDVLWKVIRIGLPAGLQMAVTAFSNIFVQSYINFFQSDCMSGWTAYNKIDQVVLLPMQSLGMAATTFVGQNLGCGQVDRAKEGIRKALLMAVSVTAVLAGCVIAAARPLVTFFNAKPEVVDYGSLFLRWLSPFYVLACANQIYAASLRGAGKSAQCTVIMLSSFVLFRQIYLFIMANYISNTVIPIAMAYPAGWIVATILTTLYYRRADFSKNKVVT